MAQTMKVSGAYGTHLASLIKVVSLTTGDILEMGMGVFSTPYLHYQAMLSNRHLVSYETDKNWLNFFVLYGYKNPNHEIIHVENWDQAKIEKQWDVVLIDHSPSERRIVDIKRLANFAKYIVIHDSNDDKRGRRIYNYNTIYPLFKYKKLWDKENNHTTVLSNFEPLNNLW